MTPLRRLELGLRVLTAVFLVVGVAAWLRSPAVPEGETPPTGLGEPAPTTAHRAPPAAEPDAAERVIAANIFSSSRRAPASRYDPYAPAADPFASTVPGFEAPDDALGMPDPDAVPRLYGTVTGPAGPAALLRLDPAKPEAQLYRVGERGGAYRVERIDGQSVVLVGPSGRVVLRLTPPPGPTGSQ
jgi:hypothetical protein